jgi:hypothetical protein
MRDDDIRLPAQELEILVADGHLRTRINGSSTYTSVPFRVPDDSLPALGETYGQLDELSRQHLPARDYQTKEWELGKDLARILFQNVWGLARDQQVGAMLEACLCTLQPGEYVRLLLSFKDPRLSNLPWELALWTTPGREICLGRDRRIALSRLEHGRAGIRRRHFLGSDRVLSLLHIDTVPYAVVKPGAAGAKQTQFAITRDFLRLIDDHVARLHTASRTGQELDTYWLDSDELTGQPAAVDIVHWDGHGGTGVEVRTTDGEQVIITAAELLERTRSAFLYVFRACDATGKMPDGKPGKGKGKGKGKTGAGATGTGATGTGSSLSVDLLDAGASAVFGTHGSVLPKQLLYLPLTYPMLLQGVPLDYCAQYMRRFFARTNADRRNGPFEPWYKLMLRTSSTWYLDAAPACSRPGSSRDRIGFVAALCRRFQQIQKAAEQQEGDGQTLVPSPAGGRAARDAIDDVVRQLYDTELMD